MLTLERVISGRSRGGERDQEELDVVVIGSVWRERAEAASVDISDAGPPPSTCDVTISAEIRGAPTACHAGVKRSRGN